jgi:hypothetical protein
MKNNLKRVLEITSVLALFLSINAVNISENTHTEKPTESVEISTQANVGYAIYRLADGSDVDNYVPEAAATLGTGGATVGFLAAGGTAALGSAKLGAKIGAIGGGLFGAIIGAGVGAL